MLPTSLFNKRILFFDTETSGLDPNKNVILQLSYIVVDGTTWNILKKVNFYFAYPDEEWRITSGAIEVNHLTREFLMFQKNSNRKEALMSFFGDLHACQLAVAHNAMFDFAFIEACAIEEKILRYAWPTICCTMSETIGICKIPFFKGSKSYKYPKLEELAVFLKVKYNKNKLHDSFSDVQLVFKCFKLLHFQKMLPLYIYENNEELATHIVNADILFPHQDTSDYIGDSLSNLIIRDEWLATYSFRRKSVTCFMSEKEVKETHVRAILQEMGGWYTPSFISDDFIISNAVIISRSMDSDKRCALQQVADFQKSNPDFPVFTIEAFRRRPEADEYEKEMRRRVIKAKETRLQRLELIKEMQKNYKIDERDRTGENDMVIDGKYYRNGKLFESCINPVVRTKKEAQLVSVPIEKRIFFDRDFKSMLKVGDYVELQLTPESKLNVLFKGNVFWSGEDKYIRHFMSIGKKKIARIIKVGDFFKCWEGEDCDSYEYEDADCYEAYANLMFYAWHDFEEWEGVNLYV